MRHNAQVLLRRSELAELYEKMRPTWHCSFMAPPSPIQGPVQLSHPCVASTLAGQQLSLRRVQDGNQKPLTYFMGQAGGLFVIEFFWQKPYQHDWHVIAGANAFARKFPQSGCHV